MARALDPLPPLTEIPGASRELEAVAHEPAPGSPAGAETGRPGAIAQAKDDLDAYTDMSLIGVMHVNDTLSRMLEFARLPISDHPDLDYEDNDAIAYRLTGTPEGTEARVLVGLEPYPEGESLYRYVQLQVDMDVGDYELIDGAMRYNPNVNLSISYDVSKPDVPTRFAMMVQRDVALGESRKAGIDAYSGRYTTGAYYWLDLLNDPDNPTTGTVGIVDAQRPSIHDFGGVMPLAGDIELDPQLLSAMLKQLQFQLARIKGED